MVVILLVFNGSDKFQNGSLRINKMDDIYFCLKLIMVQHAKAKSIHTWINSICDVAIRLNMIFSVSCT